MPKLFTFIFLVSYLISFTSAFSNLPMGSNSSETKLQVRQPGQPEVFLYSGFQVGFRDARHSGGAIRTCTLGFAVKRRSPRGGRGGFNHGYLTLGSCSSIAVRNSRRTLNVLAQAINGEGEMEVVVVGEAPSTSARYQPEQGLDYLIVRVLPNF
jgi:hypothetical protein